MGFLGICREKSVASWFVPEYEGGREKVRRMCREGALDSPTGKLGTRNDHQKAGDSRRSSDRSHRMRPGKSSGSRRCLFLLCPEQRWRCPRNESVWRRLRNMVDILQQSVSSAVRSSLRVWNSILAESTNHQQHATSSSTTGGQMLPARNLHYLPVIIGNENKNSPNALLGYTRRSSYHTVEVSRTWIY